MRQAKVRLTGESVRKGLSDGGGEECSRIDVGYRRLRASGCVCMRLGGAWGERRGLWQPGHATVCTRQPV